MIGPKIREAYTDIGIFNGGNLNEKTVFYRANYIDKSEPQPNAARMFHIPFEIRHKVITQRYSIPGFPALYLGDSAYVCWEELGRKPFREIWVSKLELTQELKVIFIEKKSEMLSRVVPEHLTTQGRVRELLKYIILFPLYMACSIRVKLPHENFKPEYILPQMLLQYCIEAGFDGIKFPSTKVNYDNLENVPAYNYVFPVKESTVKGHCPQLKNSFKISDPTSIEMEMLMHNPENQTTSVGENDVIEPEKKIKLIGDKFAFYSNTEFYRVEQCLSSHLMPLKKL